MPLPANNTPWPPKPYDLVAPQVREYHAWYSGSASELAQFYQSQTGQTRTRPSQQAGGLVGAASRFWWGKPAPDKAKTRLHVPLASDVATASASMLFSEPPRVVVGGAYTAADGTRTTNSAQARVEQILDDPHFYARLLESAEQAAALSGVYLRVVWDKTTLDHPVIDAIRPDCAVPEFRWGVLVAVTFWTDLVKDGNRVLRHLERHEPGVVLHGLYEGTANNLGHLVPLTEHPSTEWAAREVNAEGAIETGVEWLTAAYWKNTGPNRTWTDPRLTPLGRSDYDGGVLGLFDAVDEAYASLMRDLRLGKARILVPAHYLNNGGFGQGSWFDEDQEVFTPLEGMLGKESDGGSITPQQFEIRVEAHLNLITDLIRTALRGAGWSPASLGDDAFPISSTATEVKSKERLSERTRDKKIQYTKAALGPLMRTLLHVDKNVYGGTWAPPTEIPEVRFPEKAQQDVEELARTAGLLRTAEAASTVTLVRMTHPDWDGEAVDAEVERITEERNVSRPADPFSLRPGIDDDGPPAEVELEAQ